MKLFWEMPRLSWNLRFFPELRKTVNQDELTQLRYRNEARAKIARESRHKIFRGWENAGS